MSAIVQEIWQVLAESGVYLLLGFALAGLLHVVMGRYRALRRMLAPRRPRSVWLAALLGVPLPLCSCSVLPAALALRREGASKGATTSFLISVPETDVVSIMLTYALLGPVLAVYRPLAALATAVVTGLAVNTVDARQSQRDMAVDAAEERDCDRCAADHDEDVNGDRRPWLVRALRYGFVEMFDDMILQLMAGIAIAGLMLAWLPNLGLAELAGGNALSYLVMLVVGIPLYVCATASTPIAVGLIVGGFSPGAAMVFLLAGPATNIASILVLRRHFGRWILGVYWGGIAVVTVVSGIVLDAVVGTRFPLPGGGDLHEHGPGSWLHVAGALLLVVLFVGSVLRRRGVRDGVGRLRRFISRPHVHGPDCGHTAVRLGNDMLYLVSGTLQAVGEGRGVGRAIDITGRNPERCTPDRACGEGTAAHRHGPGCGHEPVRHASHVDYVVDGRLHHPHGEHCDDHGPIEVIDSS